MLARDVGATELEAMLLRLGFERTTIVVPNDVELLGGDEVEILTKAFSIE
jgi:hypothetical protein